MDRELQKIVMIGPVYPYKGGISHYTGMMFRELAKKFDVSMISFKMQYPRVLYKKEQKDYENDSFSVAGTEYLIHTANPFNIINIAKQICARKPDMALIQWWHPYFAPCYLILEHFLKKIPIVFVCHNVFPHEKFPMDKKLAGMVLKRGDAFIVQSKSDQNDLLTLKAGAVCKCTPHPSYQAFRMDGMNKQEARGRLGIDDDEKVILFFGFVREYKGLKHLIYAMPEIVKAMDHVKCLIVGDFGSDREIYMDLIEKTGCSDSFAITEGYIPDKEVEKYFAACDLVALPYESATQSGIVQIAYGFEKPVIATEVGGLPDVVIDGKTGYLVPPQNSKKLAAAIVRYFEENREDEFRENIKKEAYNYSGERMTEVVEELWQRI